MTKADLLHTPNVEGHMIVQYLGPVFARGQFDAALDEITEQANALGADKVVGLLIEPVSARRFSAQGTAVKIQKL